MKTAMQELIEKLSNSIKFEYRNELVNALEKEKDKIENAFDMGRDETTIKFIEDGKDYYNKTYNK